jgi:hypothetical protein
MRELPVLLSISLEAIICLSHTHPITTTIITREEMVKLAIMEVVLTELLPLKPSNPSMAQLKMLLINKSHSRRMEELRAVQPIIMRPKLS